MNSYYTKLNTPNVIRARKDIIDLRPIQVRQGARGHSYRWKMIALLEHNDNGDYVLPFSQRVIDIRRQLWPRSFTKPPPSGYDLCGCIGCEEKTWADHILKYDEYEDPEQGQLHLEEVCSESDDDEKDNEPDETSSNGDEDNDDSDSTLKLSSPTITSTTTTTEDQHTSDDGSMSDDPPSPFPCDPYESYDWEC